jgi:hypothetical protein
MVPRELADRLASTARLFRSTGARRLGEFLCGWSGELLLNPAKGSAAEAGDRGGEERRVHEGTIVPVAIYSKLFYRPRRFFVSGVFVSETIAGITGIYAAMPYVTVGNSFDVLNASSARSQTRKTCAASVSTQPG